MRVGKWLRILGWTAGGILTLIVLTLLATYFVLKMPSVQQKIITSLKEPLAKEGVVLDVKSLSVDLLAGVTLDGLTLQLRRPPEMEGDLKLRELRLGYAIWPLLHRELQVKEARISGLDGQIELHLPPPAEPKPEEPADPEALTKLLDLLRKPPLTVDMPAIELNEVNVKLQVFQGPLTALVLTKNLGLKSSLSLEEGTSALRLQADLPIAIEISSTEGLSLKTDVRVRPDLEWHSQIKEQDFAWQFQLTTLDVDLAGFAFSKSDPTGKMALDLPKLSLSVWSKLDHKGPVPPSAVKPVDIALPLSAEGGWELKSDPLRFHKAGETVLNLLAELSGQSQFKAVLPGDLQTLDQAQWSLQQTLDILGLDLRQGKEVLVASKSLGIKAEAEGEKGEGKLNMQLLVEALKAKTLGESLNLRQDLDAQVNLPARKIDLQLRQNLNRKDWLILKAAVADQAPKLSVNLDLKADVPPEWRNLHSALASMDLIGWPKLALQADIQVEHPMPLEEINGENWPELIVQSQVDAQVQQQKAGPKTIARFQELSLKTQAKLQGKAVDAQVRVALQNVQHKLLKKTADVSQHLDLKAAFGDWLSADLLAKTSLDKTDLLDLKLGVRESTQRLAVSSDLSAYVSPELRHYMDGLDILQDVGVLTLKSSDQLDLRYKAQRLAEVTSWAPKDLNLTLKSKQDLTQKAQKDLKYKLAQGLSIVTQASLKAKKARLETHASIPEAGMKDLLDASGIKAHVIGEVADVDTLDRVTVGAEGGAAKLLLSGEDKQALADITKDASFRVAGQVLNKDRLKVPVMQASVQGDLFRFKASGEAALSSGRGGFQGLVSSALPPGKTLAGVSGKGRFEVPFSLTLYDKKVLAVKADPKFENFSVAFKDMAVTDMHGKISIQEELRLTDAGRIDFLYLDTQNPFARVDFESVDPYLGQRSLLSIQKLKMGHLEAGPMVQNFELRQNLILLNDLKVDLLKGSALGRLFVDLHPDRLSLGFLGRFSGLQAELLKAPALRKNTQTAVLDGRMATTFDIRKRLASGRIDITSIGRDQLLSLIDFLDPKYEDDQMMMARRALQLAYPNLVSIAMDQGLMDLTIGLGGVVSKDITVRSIPLTGFINAHAGELLQKLESLLISGGP